MPSRIVTSTYRYKRPPRKKKPILLEVPAIVTRKSDPRPIVQRAKAGNDNRPAEQPVAIVTAKKPRGRKAAWGDDGQETPPEIKALIERMMLGRGPGSST